MTSLATTIPTDNMEEFFNSNNSESSSNNNASNPLGPGKLTIEVISASDLPSADIQGSSDPYCKIKCGSFKQQTKAIQNDLNPVWNECLCLFIYLSFYLCYLFTYI